MGKRETESEREGEEIKRRTCTNSPFFCLKETGLYAGLLAAAVPL